MLTRATLNAELPSAALSWLTHGRTDTQTQASTIPEGQNWPLVKRILVSSVLTEETKMRFTKQINNWDLLCWRLWKLVGYVSCKRVLSTMKWLNFDKSEIENDTLNILLCLGPLWPGDATCRHRRWYESTWDQDILHLYSLTSTEPSGTRFNDIISESHFCSPHHTK